MISRPLSRRRFLAISAAVAATGPAHAATRWTGIAFGAEASITLHGPTDKAAAALAAARTEIDRAENLFSLYRPDSWISHLNRDGQATASPQVQDLLARCDQAYELTDGLFDPTVQALWIAAAEGTPLGAARNMVDWRQVRVGTDVTLGRGQAITLNGIAQGWATDRVTEALAAHGFENALVNIGEFAARDGDWRIGISDPKEGLVRTITLTGGAVATSSPTADLIRRRPHIFGPSGQPPLWSTVSVEAKSASLADALSTALCLAPRALTAEIARLNDVSAITLVALNGDLEVLR